MNTPPTRYSTDESNASSCHLQVPNDDQNNGFFEVADIDMDGSDAANYMPDPDEVPCFSEEQYYQVVDPNDDGSVDPIDWQRHVASGCTSVFYDASGNLTQQFYGPCGSNGNGNFGNDANESYYQVIVSDDNTPRETSANVDAIIPFTPNGAAIGANDGAELGSMEQVSGNNQVSASPPQQTGPSDVQELGELSAKEPTARTTKGGRKPRQAKAKAPVPEKKRSYVRRSKKTDNTSVSVTVHHKPNDSVIEGGPVFKTSDGSQYIVVNPAALTPNQAKMMTINQPVVVDRNGKATFRKGATSTVAQELNAMRSNCVATVSSSNQVEGKSIHLAVTKNGVGDMLHQVREQPAGPLDRLVSSKISNINGPKNKSTVSPTVILQNQNLYSQLTAPTKQLSIQTQKLSQERWSQYPNPSAPQTSSPTSDQYRSGYQPMRSRSCQNSAAIGSGMSNSGTNEADSSDMRRPHGDNSAIDADYPENGVANGGKIATFQQRIKFLENQLKTANMRSSQLNLQNFEIKTRYYYLNKVNRHTMLRLRQLYEENEILRCSVDQLRMKGRPETTELILQDIRSIQSKHHGTPQRPNGQFGSNGPNGQFGSNGPNGQFGPNGYNCQFGSNEPNGPNGQFGSNRPNGFGSGTVDFNGSTVGCYNTTLHLGEEMHRGSEVNDAGRLEAMHSVKRLVLNGLKRGLDVENVSENEVKRARTRTISSSEMTSPLAVAGDRMGNNGNTHGGSVVQDGAERANFYDSTDSLNVGGHEGDIGNTPRNERSGRTSSPISNMSTETEKTSPTGNGGENDHTDITEFVSPIVGSGGSATTQISFAKVLDFKQEKDNFGNDN